LFAFMQVGFVMLVESALNPMVDTMAYS